MTPKDILLKLIKDQFSGNQAAFSRAIKRSPAQVNQWLTGYRKLDVKGQRHIETALKLRPGYMSGEPNYITAPTQSSFAINETLKHELRPLVQKVYDLAEQIDDIGLRNLIDIAELLARNHPIAKAKRA